MNKFPPAVEMIFQMSVLLSRRTISQAYFSLHETSHKSSKFPGKILFFGTEGTSEACLDTDILIHPRRLLSVFEQCLLNDFIKHQKCRTAEPKMLKDKER
jgi:hypothetical protein